MVVKLVIKRERCGMADLSNVRWCRRRGAFNLHVHNGESTTNIHSTEAVIQTVFNVGKADACK
jgi:hypothetical protein